MGQLTTHVLDTARGRPGAGMRVELYTFASGNTPLVSTVTNDDGRCDAPLLEGDAFQAGEYKLVFHAGEYFQASTGADGPGFLDRVVIRFHVTQAEEDYHVPLLLSPFGYTTYRGS